MSLWNGAVMNPYAEPRRALTFVAVSIRIIVKDIRTWGQGSSNNLGQLEAWVQAGDKEGQGRMREWLGGACLACMPWVQLLLGWSPMVILVHLRWGSLLTHGPLWDWVLLVQPDLGMLDRLKQMESWKQCMHSLWQVCGGLDYQPWQQTVNSNILKECHLPFPAMRKHRNVLWPLTLTCPPINGTDNVIFWYRKDLKYMR